MTNGTPTRADQLVAIARPAIQNLTGADLTPAEEKFLRAIAEGRLANFSAGKEEDDDPSNASQWKEDRVLRAPCIAWLCTDPDAMQLLTHRGILARGALIDGKLDLQFARLDVPFYFQKCAFAAGINLRQADLHSLMLPGTHTAGIAADSLKVRRNIFLRDGFKAQGEVRLLGASIGGNLECGNAHFSNPGNKALSADGVKVEGDVLLRNGFKAEGEVRLLGASIGGDLDCGNGQFSNPGNKALIADGITVAGNVFLGDGFKAEGEVRLLGASIGRDLGCNKGQFSSADKNALTADGVKVAGSVLLGDGFKAEGEVRLLGAFIDQGLDCSNGQFSNPGSKALNADGVKVGGSVFLRDGFKATGEVRLPGASIGGDLDCGNGEFSNLGKNALIADGVKVGGSVFLRDGFKADGNVSLASAEIGKSLQWRGVRNPEKTTLDLRSAKVGALWDEAASWPPKGQLRLEGFVYNELFHQAPSSAEDRIDWLNRSSEDPGALPNTATRSEKRAFFGQPYQQLASVLRKSGQEDEADEILIEKNKRAAQWTRKGSANWWWYRVIGPPIKYGYRPMVTFKWSLAIIVLGVLLFGWGYQSDLITPTSKDAYGEENGKPTSDIREDYPRFNSWIYSTEMFVPLVKFYQAEYWLPNANRGTAVFPRSDLTLTWGGALRIYLWVHIALGWTLTTIWVAGLTGVIKKSG